MQTKLIIQFLLGEEIRFELWVETLTLAVKFFFFKCDICGKILTVDIWMVEIHTYLFMSAFMLFYSFKIFLTMWTMRKLWLRGELNALHGNTTNGDRQGRLPCSLTPLNGGLQQLKTKVQMKDTRKKALRMSSRQSCRNWVISVL